LTTNNEEVFLQQVLNQLIKLQKLDSQFAQLESLRGDLPHQVKRLKKEVEDSEKSLTMNEEKLRAYQKERGITEMEVMALQGKEKKYQSQLFEVKTNREYDAVTHEIEAVKTGIQEKETRILELMDLEEEMKQLLKNNETEIENIRNQLDKVSKKLSKQIEKTEKDEAVLMHEKEKIERKLTPRHLTTYERIRKAKNGLAVVSVLRNACGGCFKTLPPQRILEIRNMDRIFLCEVCGRILVWDEKES